MSFARTSDRNRLWLTTLATSLGFVLVQLDVSIVNVGLAPIGASLGIGMAGLEWVVDAYTLAFASLMLSAGALGDRIGSRCAFIAGFGLFIVSSIGCGVAPTGSALIAARTVQGIGAAALVPCSLALLNHATGGDAKARAHAVGLWTAAGAVALAVGPALGGSMIALFGWRSLFLVNAPIGLIGIVTTARWIDETEPGKAGLDPVGQTLSVVALSAATAAVIEGGALGWQSPLVLVLALLAVAAAIGFLYAEATIARPMLPFGFFRLPNFSPATLVGLGVNFTLYGGIFIFNLFLQRYAGYSPVRAGLVFLPFPAALLIANIGAGPLVARFGPRWPMTFGLIVGVAGFALLATVRPTTPWLLMLPGLILVPLGIGTAVPAMTTALLSSVPRARAGVASGVLNTVRQAGGAIGVALFGTLLAQDGTPGLAGAFIMAAAVLGAATLAAMFGIKESRRAEARQFGFR
jgi:MFS transporter, DHA2 family, methylenomycin A resistance protein